MINNIPENIVRGEETGPVLNAKRGDSRSPMRLSNNPMKGGVKCLRQGLKRLESLEYKSSNACPSPLNKKVVILQEWDSKVEVCRGVFNVARLIHNSNHLSDHNRYS